MAEDIYANLEIEPREVKQLIDRGERFCFVDVREGWEHQLCHIENSELIPMREIPANLPKFEGEQNIVIFCHSGRRSFEAAAWLRTQGVSGARSMAGGIDRWSAEIDPKVPRY